MQQFLNVGGVMNFSPVRFVFENGVNKRIQVLPGHIFVQGPLEHIDLVKSEYEGDKLKYLMAKEGGKPLAFSNELLQHFMKVAAQQHAGVEFLDARREINVKHGPLVRVKAQGPFHGVVGEYLRVRSNRCVVVRIGGLVTVATGFLKPDEVEAV